MMQKKENACNRNNQELKKVIKEQAKGFKRIHKILEEKTKEVFELRKENVELNWKIKKLEIEIRRLKND